MEVRQFSKRPLTVGAFQFDAEQAQRRLAPGCSDVAVGPVTLWLEENGVWHVYNPGRATALEGPWQRVNHGDFIIIAPTGCRYPVQADQFERNYAEVVQDDDVAREAA